jgi:hypothetical protein
MCEFSKENNVKKPYDADEHAAGIHIRLQKDGAFRSPDVFFLGQDLYTLSDPKDMGAKVKRLQFQGGEVLMPSLILEDDPSTVSWELPPRELDFEIKTSHKSTLMGRSVAGEKNIQDSL